MNVGEGGRKMGLRRWWIDEEEEEDRRRWGWDGREWSKRESVSETQAKTRRRD